MDIKILGPACVNCLKLELLVAQALKETGLEAKIIKIVEDKEISRYRGDPPINLVSDDASTSRNAGLFRCEEAGAPHC